jgi:hypothetical protein
VGVLLKIVLAAWLFLIVLYAGLRLAGYPREAAAKRLRLIDSVFFYGLLGLIIVVAVVFS